MRFMQLSDQLIKLCPARHHVDVPNAFSTLNGCSNRSGLGLFFSDSGMGVIAAAELLPG